jgi:hypothetical protein
VSAALMLKIAFTAVTELQLMSILGWFFSSTQNYVSERKSFSNRLMELKAFISQQTTEKVSTAGAC